MENIQLQQKQYLIIDTYDADEEIDKLMPKEGLTKKEKVYELGDAIEVYRYIYQDSTYSVVLYHSEDGDEILIARDDESVIPKLLDEILDKIFVAIEDRFGTFDDEQQLEETDWGLEIYYPDEYTATNDSGHHEGEYYYLNIEVQGVNIQIPAYVTQGNVSIIVSINASSIMESLETVLDGLGYSLYLPRDDLKSILKWYLEELLKTEKLTNADRIRCFSGKDSKGHYVECRVLAMSEKEHEDMTCFRNTYVKDIPVRITFVKFPGHLEDISIKAYLK